MNRKEFWKKTKRRLLACFYSTIGGRIRLKSDTVLFFTFQGKYTCNPKYICRRLHGIAPELRCVWVVLSEEDRGAFPDFVETVLYGTREYFLTLYSAKVLVDNGFNFIKLPFRKKKKQYYIETMHGSLGIKRIDAASNPDPGRNRTGARCGRMTAYIISNSDFENEVYRSSFWETTPILLYGHARNDILIRDADGSSEDSRQLREKVRDFYGLPSGAKLALCGPTFEREASRKFEEFDAAHLRDCLTERFGGDWYILKRLHPRDFRNRTVKTDREFILDGNSYTDIQELMVAIDFAVTDYSSWIFDYVVTKKPGMIYAPDLEEYQNSTGFYYPITAAPFPLATDNASVSELIRNFDLTKYAEEVDVFLTGKGCVDDGKASDRAAQMIRGLTVDRLPETAE